MTLVARSVMVEDNRLITTTGEHLQIKGRIKDLRLKDSPKKTRSLNKGSTLTEESHLKESSAKRNKQYIGTCHSVSNNE